MRQILEASADKTADKTAAERSIENAKLFVFYGERGRNRTFNLLIKSQLLCQLSYAPAAVGETGWALQKLRLNQITTLRTRLSNSGADGRSWQRCGSDLCDVQ